MDHAEQQAMRTQARLNAAKGSSPAARCGNMEEACVASMPRCCQSLPHRQRSSTYTRVLTHVCARHTSKALRGALRVLATRLPMRKAVLLPPELGVEKPA